MKITKVLTKNVKLVGGPMDGRVVAVPRSAEQFLVGKVGAWFWRYNYAGKIDRQEQFALVPKSRRMQKFILWYVGKHGKDPRVEGAARGGGGEREASERWDGRVGGGGVAGGAAGDDGAGGEDGGDGPDGAGATRGGDDVREGDRRGASRAVGAGGGVGGGAEGDGDGAGDGRCAGGP